MVEFGSEDSRGVLPGGTWPLKVVAIYIYNLSLKCRFPGFPSRVSVDLNFEMTVYSGVFQKYHSVDRAQENVGFV